MSTTALVVVPPFLKLAYGPLLGPAMLIGAGRRAGHDVHVVDLNAPWIRERLPPLAVHEPRRFIGDHDRPSGLSVLHVDFKRELGLADRSETHEDVLATAVRLAGSTFGTWVTRHLAAQRSVPEVIGVSVMYRDQVEPALAITIVARTLWPNALIVWGGAHVTALRDEIAADERYACQGLIDRFVFGYAERTWVELLDAIAARTQPPAEAMRPGCGCWHPAVDDGTVVPAFDALDNYDPTKLTLPLQSSRGCSYGLCGHCTYPSIEGSARNLPLASIDPVIAQAVSVRGALSFKDSLLDGARLEEVADRVAGRAKWSACTKLDAKLPGRLARLAAGGCATLEIGLETIDLDAQKMILKRQRVAVFYELLNAAAAVGVALVVNYMIGLPGADPHREATCMATVQAELDQRKPQLVSKLEHNKFQLERLSPIGRDPERFGIRIKRRVPWSSVLEWEPRPRVIPLGHEAAVTVMFFVTNQR